MCGEPHRYIHFICWYVLEWGGAPPLCHGLRYGGCVELSSVMVSRVQFCSGGSGELRPVKLRFDMMSCGMVRRLSLVAASLGVLRSVLFRRLS